MIRLLTTCLGLLDKIFDFFNQQKWKREGRQETIKEINDAINRQIELGAAADTIPDLERDGRLRNKYDRARLYE